MKFTKLDTGNLCFVDMASSFSSPWPDPNSPLLSKFDFGVPLVELFKWLDVRDTFLGQNEREQDVTAALVLARDCKHPDAEWLTSIFEGKDVSTKEDVKKVLLLHENDARALCFAWFLTCDRKDLLRRSAEMGYAFACSTLSSFVWDEDVDEAFRLADLAQNERDVYAVRARWYFDEDGDEDDFNFAAQSLLVAAELGHVRAAGVYGSVLDESDPDRWIWLERSAMRDFPDAFLDSFSNEVEQFFSGSGNPSAVYLIGRTLKGNIDVQRKLIFGRRYYDFDSWVGPANQAVSFYYFQIDSARLAVDTWTLVSTRLRMIKDMRVFIGKMIWEARFEANYKVSARTLRAQKRSRK